MNTSCYAFFIIAVLSLASHEVVDVCCAGYGNGDAIVTDFDFASFYVRLKEKGFVIYPGKISDADTFRIGNIGDVYPDDFKKLVTAIKEIQAVK